MQKSLARVHQYVKYYMCVLYFLLLGSKDEAAYRGGEDAGAGG